jgi:hypothetical protein
MQYRQPFRTGSCRQIAATVSEYNRPFSTVLSSSHAGKIWHRLDHVRPRDLSSDFQRVILNTTPQPWSLHWPPVAAVPNRLPALSRTTLSGLPPSDPPVKA